MLFVKNFLCATGNITKWTPPRDLWSLSFHIFDAWYLPMCLVVRLWLQSRIWVLTQPGLENGRAYPNYYTGSILIFRYVPLTPSFGKCNQTLLLTLNWCDLQSMLCGLLYLLNRYVLDLLIYLLNFINKFFYYVLFFGLFWGTNVNCAWKALSSGAKGWKPK